MFNLKPEGLMFFLKLSLKNTNQAELDLTWKLQGMSLATCSRPAGGRGTVHWKQGYRGQFHILHWTLLLFCSSGEIKVRIQYFKLVLIHFMSNVWLKAHFPQKSYVIWWKISIFDTKNLISRYFTTFHFPNYLNLQKMNKIQLYGCGEIQAKQI